jgi:hypothetical protein
MDWDEIVGIRPDWCPPSWRLWAVFPSPVEADACFQEAGFTSFADADAAWDDDFAWAIHVVIAELSRDGAARMTEGDYPHWEGTDESVFWPVLAAATDDNFHPCVLSFGDGRALLRTQDGHAILWIARRGGDIDNILSVLRTRFVEERTCLDWTRLL